MRLSLLRCSYEPDPIPDRGIHNFKYAIVPYRGDWKAANTLRDGYELNQPLLSVLADRHEAILPLEASFANCSADNIIITCLKKCEDDDSLILRFYETHGKSVEATFQFSFKILHACETDLLERNLADSELVVEDNGFTVQVAPYEIKTFRVVREAIKWQRRHNFVPV